MTRSKPMGSVELACKQCQRPFRLKLSAVRRGYGAYCSKTCMATAYKTRMIGNANPNYREASKKVCERCGADFHSYVKSRRFCSSICANDSRRKPDKMCQICGTKILRHQKNLVCRNCKTNIGRAESKNNKNNCRECGTEIYRAATLCRPCFSSGKTRLPMPACAVCGAVVPKRSRKYCDPCWAVIPKQKRGTARRQDANHTEIVVALKRRKYCVFDTSSLGSGFPDIIVLRRNGGVGEAVLMEIKTKVGKLNERQRQWHANIPAPVFVVRNIDEAFRALNGDMTLVEVPWRTDYIAEDAA